MTGARSAHRGDAVPAPAPARCRRGVAGTAGQRRPPNPSADATQHRLRRAHVVEVALALVLVTGRLARSFVGLMSVDPLQRDRAVQQVFAWDSNPTPAQLNLFM